MRMHFDIGIAASPGPVGAPLEGPADGDGDHHFNPRAQHPPFLNALPPPLGVQAVGGVPVNPNAGAQLAGPPAVVRAQDFYPEVDEERKRLAKNASSRRCRDRRNRRLAEEKQALVDSVRALTLQRDQIAANRDRLIAENHEVCFSTCMVSLNCTNSLRSSGGSLPSFPRRSSPPTSAARLSCPVSRPRLIGMRRHMWRHIPLTRIPMIMLRISPVLLATGSSEDWRRLSGVRAGTFCAVVLRGWLEGWGGAVFLPQGAPQQLFVWALSSRSQSVCFRRIQPVQPNFRVLFCDDEPLFWTRHGRPNDEQTELGLVKTRFYR
jgi:hypothetical protein